MKIEQKSKVFCFVDTFPPFHPPSICEFIQVISQKSNSEKCDEISECTTAIHTKTEKSAPKMVHGQTNNKSIAKWPARVFMFFGLFVMSFERGKNSCSFYRFNEIITTETNITT